MNDLDLQGLEPLVSSAKLFSITGAHKNTLKPQGSHKNR